MEGADEETSEDANDEDDGFGDDFDDFEEGQEGDDFGEFDDGFQQAAVAETSHPPQPPAFIAQPLPFSIPDYSQHDTSEEIREAIAIQMESLFPEFSDVKTGDFPKPTPHIFLSDRSHSLYSQLIAPPPLAPSDWLRSRIRRLFFVSLGVPVDLDEILPASKQKKLILPSIHLNASDRSPRPSMDNKDGAPANGAVTRLKGKNDSTASVDSKGGRRRRKDEVQEPRLDLGEAVRLGSTTEVKLSGLSDAELKEHVAKLEKMVKRAEEVLGFWQGKKDGAVKEKEAFEGVIENLVKHARKVRK